MYNLSLREKTIKGLSWSLANNISTNGIQFVIGIILARLLSPVEFGLIGMTAIFTAIARTFVDSGFTTALIRKNQCTQEEFSTVFYYNMFIGIILYFLLFLTAPLISNFFNEPKLINLVRVISLNIVILSISQIQRTILIKKIDFKRQTLISIIAMVCSGAVAITLAIRGFGVWSLVVLQLLRSVLETVLLWITGHWHPSIIFSMEAFKELFGFGNKMLATGLLNTAYRNVYNLVIGKYFSATELGFYSRARRFSNIVGQNVNSIIQSVTFPVLASIGDDDVRLRANYKRLLMSSSIISAFLSLSMAACAHSLVLGLLGQQWATSIPYLQLLCLAGMLYPIHSLNLNILKVKGRSDLFLKLAVYKKLLAIPTIIVGIVFGIIPMLTMVVVSSVIAFFINTLYSGKLIDYSTFEQIKNIAPSFVLAVIIALPVYIAGIVLNLKPILLLLVQATLAVAGAVLVGHVSKYEGVVEVKEVITSQLKMLRRQ